MTRTPGTEHVASLERGLRVLQTFSRSNPQLTLSQVAALAGLTPATARRSLHTLERLGYVARSGRKFLLRPRVLALGAGYLNAINADVVLQPFVDEVVNEHGGSSSVTVLDDVDIVYVERFRASRRLQTEIDLDLHVGSRLPAYCTSMGKVLLAFMPDTERDELLGRITFARRGPNTLTSKTALLAELHRIRETGIAVNNEELAYGLRSVAVPVFSAGGEAVAALNLAAHRTMASLDDLIARLGPIMQRTAAAISAQLGYRSTPV